MKPPKFKLVDFRHYRLRKCESRGCLRVSTYLEFNLAFKVKLIHTVHSVVVFTDTLPNAYMLGTYRNVPYITFVAPIINRRLHVKDMAFKHFWREDLGQTEAHMVIANACLVNPTQFFSPLNGDFF